MALYSNWKYVRVFLEKMPSRWKNMSLLNPYQDFSTCVALPHLQVNFISANVTLYNQTCRLLNWVQIPFQLVALFFSLAAAASMLSKLSHFRF